MGEAPPIPVFILRRHRSDITALHYVSPESNKRLTNKEVPALLSGSRSGEIYFWDLEIKRVDAELLGHDEKSITWLSVHENNVLSQGRDGFINIWLLHNGKWEIKCRIQSSEVGFCSAKILLKHKIPYLLIPRDDGSIKVSDYDTGSVVSELKSQSHGMCMCVKVFSQDDQWIVLCGYEDGNLLLWRCGDNTVMSTLKCHTEPVFCFDFDSVHSRRGVSGSAEDRLQIWAVDENMTLTKRQEVKLKNSGVNDVAIRPDGKIFITGGWDSKVRVFSWKTLKPLAILTFHEQSVQCLQFFSEPVGGKASMFATGSKDTNIALWTIY